MSLELLKHEVLKPGYILCNECANLDMEGICKIYKGIPPKDIMLSNTFKEKNNLDVCKDFKLRS